MFQEKLAHTGGKGCLGDESTMFLRSTYFRLALGIGEGAARRCHVDVASLGVTGYSRSASHAEPMRQLQFRQKRSFITSYATTG
ncbi:hypothetical protein J6590_083815 [Homalodisca vitripennis]|nr:hypothetical protein J6590_083815 [Homalodisca vitripennis]